MDFSRARNWFAQVSEESGSQSGNTKHPQRVQQTIVGLMLMVGGRQTTSEQENPEMEREGDPNATGAKGTMMVAKNGVPIGARVQVVVGCSFREGVRVAGLVARTPAALATCTWLPVVSNSFQG